jgi:uncharacterized protein (DUF58 family)
MMMNRVTGLLRDVLRVRRGGRTTTEVNAPLLGDADLAALLHMTAPPPARSHPGEVKHRQAGEFRSGEPGSGLDFAESRPYQPGDDVRRMDWRTTARTGTPFLKVYHEEHQRRLHVVIDRGASMRFGTRGRLKAAQAARIAALLAFAHARANVCIGATLWERDGEFLPCRNGEAGVMQLLHAAVAPCPPLPAAETDRARTFTRLLRELNARLPRGSRVALISDFRALDATHVPDLARLAAQHECGAYQVLDPVECDLPDVGMSQFADLESDRIRWLDTHSATVRAQFNAGAAALHERQRALLRRAGVPLCVCMTSDDAPDLVLKHA